MRDAGDAGRPRSREGYELHYGAPAVVVSADDPDLALLAGDRLYALGLRELAAAGDLEAIGDALRDDRDVRAGRTPQDAR